MRPKREHATNYGQSYMVTSETWGRRGLFRAEPWARLLIDTLYHYRGSAYLLHEFVIMPEHLHALITPLVSLERAVQFIKGGFSYRAKKELGSNLEIWQKGFSDHRIRDAADCERHVAYIHENPVKKRFVTRPEEYEFSSAHAGFALDEVPQGLKPQNLADAYGAPEGAPLQNRSEIGCGPLQNETEIGCGSEGAPLQNDMQIESVLQGASLQNQAHLECGPQGDPFQNDSDPVKNDIDQSKTKSNAA